jgi:hypothetical protein
MASGVPKGWDKESEKLFIHETGVRIARQTYKGKDGWYLIPVDLDAVVVEFEPTPEGRDKAFEAFTKGALVTKPKKTRTVTKKAVAKPPAKGEEGEEEKDDDDEAEEKDDEGDDEA